MADPIVPTINGELALLVEQFDLAIRTPDDVAQLKQLILQLAVMGKLVPQDPDDEPAAVLLERMNGRSKVTSKGRLSYPIPLPQGWMWVRLGEIVEGLDAGWSPKCENVPADNGEWGVLKTTAVQRMSFLNAENKRLPNKLKPRPQYEVVPGDILITRAGPRHRVGIACVVDETRPMLMLSDKIIRFHPPSDLFDPTYIALTLNSGHTREHLESKKSGMAASQMNISQTKLLQTPVPIAPLGIQHRIVAKVDELLATADELSGRLAAAGRQRQRFHTAALHQLTTAETPTQTAAAWSLLDGRFDALYDDPAAVAELKQAILQLAVMGRLVPQDPDDEPAAVLLERIGEEKEVSGHRVRRKSGNKPNPDRELFAAPQGWQWCRLEEAILNLQTGPFGSNLHKSDYVQHGIPVINPADIRDGVVSADNAKQVDEATLDRLSTYKLDAGDILMARRGEMGRCAPVTQFEDGWLCGTGCLILRMTDHTYQTFFVMVIQAESSREYLRGGSVGATMSNLNQKTLLNMPVALPPFAEQHRIVAKVDELFALADEVAARAGAAEAARGRLLAALVGRGVG